MRNKRIIKPNHVFQEIISAKKNISNNSFIIFYQKNLEPNFLRYGISVGKKVGNAVVRNKVKRQMRMMIQSLVKKYGMLDYQIIILVKKNYLQKNYDENNNALEMLLMKLN